MNEAQWQDVDAYLCDALVPSDPVLDEALAASLRDAKEFYERQPQVLQLVSRTAPVHAGPKPRR